MIATAWEPLLPVPWNEDDPRDLPVIEANLRSVLGQIVRDAARRDLPTVVMAQEWHRRTYENVRVPVPYYRGEVRDSDPRFPELFGYEVIVGGKLGVPSRAVPEQLDVFERSLRQAVGMLDSAIPVRRTSIDFEQLRSVLTLCAYSHGEWVRIHPFANGNGRTARLWANWSAVRYGLPPFVRLKPRPEGRGYAVAAGDSMRGDHRAMVTVFAEMLERSLLESSQR
jgi:Fic/DOC family